MDQNEVLMQARIDIASHEAEISALRDGLKDLKEAVGEMKKTVEGMRDQLTEARGGWKTLMLLGGAGAAFGSAITGLLQQLTGRHP